MKEKTVEMDELRSWFEVPAIAHYFHIFRRSFELIDFEIEDFEETLFLDSAENVSTFLPDLVIRLLRGMYKTKDGLNVTLENYNYYLRDLLSHHYVSLQKKQNPVADCDFKVLGTRTKVEILFDMCNWRLELLDAMELTKDLDADEMRVEPIGRDNDGNIYWYFYGTRLYKEGFSVNHEEPVASDHSESDTERKVKTTKMRKKRKIRVGRKSGRSLRKKRKMDDGSQESDNDSERSIEIPDVDAEDSDLCEPGTKALKLNLSVNAWSLACSTLGQWEELCNQFKGAKTKNEKDFRKKLCALYEDMPELFDEREKALQRKLIAMMPRRVSDRITIKMKQREDEERRMEQERLLKSQQKMKDAEERQKHHEEEKEKEREQRYKERERIQEERALRAKLRETQKLVADNPELANEIQPVAVGMKNKIKKNHSNDEYDFDEDYEDDDIHAAMKRIMDVLNNDDDAWPFLEPVNEEEAPHYYEYIKSPMDFKTICEKIEEKRYRDKEEFEDDVYLVFDNCETYNGTQSSFTKLALVVKKVFDKLMKREFPPVMDVDDDDFFEVDDLSIKTGKSKKSKQTKLDSPLFMPDSPHQVVGAKKVPSTSRIAGNTVHAQTLQAQVRLKQIHQNAAMLHTSPRAALAAAANILPARFGISPETIAKMSPAQMQALVLGYPRIIASSVTAVEANATQVDNPNTTSTNTFSNTTFLTPLQQLADTALAPSTCSIRKLISEPKFLSSNTEGRTGVVTPKAVVSATLPATPYYIVKSDGSMTLTQGAKQLSQNVRLSRTTAAPCRVSNRGRPRKIVIPSKKSLLVLTNNKNTVQATTVTGGYVSGYNSVGAPITVKWDDLKKQLMSQMHADTHISLDLPSSQVDTTGIKTSTISAMPILRPVGAPRPLNPTSSTATTHSNTKMFSFSNILKTSVPTEKNTDVPNQTTTVVSSATADTGSKLTNQNNESKVQNWLNSSRPFIEEAVTIVHSTRSSSGSFSSPVMASPSSVLMTGNKLSGNRHVLVPPTLRSVISTKVRPVISTKVRPVVSISNGQPHRVKISSAAPPSKQSLLELEKAARQAAVVNQLSTKLQTHLSDGGQHPVPSSSNKVDISNVKIECITSCLMTPSQTSVKSPLKMDVVLRSPVAVNLPVAEIVTPTTSCQKSVTPLVTSMCLVNQLKLQQPIRSNTTLPSHPISSVDSKTFSIPIPRIRPSGKQSILQLKQSPQNLKLESSTVTNKALPYVIKSVVPQTSPNIPLSPSKFTGAVASTGVFTQPGIRFVQIPESALSAQSLIVQQKINNQTIRYVIPGQSTIVGNNVLNLSQLGGMQNVIVNNSPVLGNPSTANVQFVLNSNLNSNVKILNSPQVLTTTKTKLPSSPLANVSDTSKQNELCCSESVSLARNGVVTNGESSHVECTTKKQVWHTQQNSSVAKVQTFIEKNHFHQNKSHQNLCGETSAQPSPTAGGNPLSISIGTMTHGGTYSNTSNKPVVSHVKSAVTTSVSTLQNPNFQQAIVAQKSLSVTPAQLQKLKDEGRILMTSSGQLVMIPTSNLNAHVK